MTRWLAFGYRLTLTPLPGTLLEGNSNAATSAAFLKQLRARHTEPLTVIWGNSPAHRGDALRAYLSTPDLNLRLESWPETDRIMARGYTPGNQG